ncbi:MAG: hypothetical protein RKK11_05090 [Alphaproteobacteria bacterium]
MPYSFRIVLCAAAASSIMTVSSSAHAQNRIETPYGDWVHVQSTDPLDDTTKHLAYIYDEENTPNGAIVFQCDEAGDPELGAPYVKYLQQRAFFGNQGFGQVTYRVDDRPPVEAEWNLARDQIVSFDRNDVMALVEALAGGQALILEANDWQHTPHRNTFSLNGASDAVNAVVEGCQNGTN